MSLIGIFTLILNQNLHSLEEKLVAAVIYVLRVSSEGFGKCSQTRLCCDPNIDLILLNHLQIQNL